MVDNNEKLPIICFPWGGAGNHIRWLLTIDESISLPFGTLGFIKNNVYNNERTWCNWLQMEWKYRKELDSNIIIEHQIEKLHTYINNRIIFLKINNASLAANHYFHLNLGMNSFNPTTFMESLRQWNYKLELMQPNPNWLVIESDCIYNKTLDYTFYKTIVDFYDFSDQYNTAMQIHELYCQCRINAATDFYDYFTSNEFAEYLNYMKNLEKMMQG